MVTATPRIVQAPATLRKRYVSLYTVGVSATNRSVSVITVSDYSYATYRLEAKIGAWPSRAPTRSRPGRRARSEQAIPEATRALLARGRRARAHDRRRGGPLGRRQATIYRRWRVKDELAPAAVWNDLASGLQAPRDVGDTPEELRGFLAPLITCYNRR